MSWVLVGVGSCSDSIQEEEIYFLILYKSYNLSYADDHPYGRKLRTEEPLDESEGDWKSWLKRNIQKTKIMASDPIKSWQINEETMETVTDFIFLGSKITADGDHSHEIKKMPAPWKKSYEQPR